MTDKKEIVGHLANFLLQLTDKAGPSSGSGLNAASEANVVGVAAKPSSTLTHGHPANPTFTSTSQLVEYYHKKQRSSRSVVPSKKSTKQKSQTNRMFSLNFAQYRRSGRLGYKMVPPGRVQIPGFEEDNVHSVVILKAAKGLGLDVPSHRLSLVISNSLVKDRELPSGEKWTLGNYTNEFGGPQARAKRTFGIYVEEESTNSDDDLELPSGPLKSTPSGFLKSTPAVVYEDSQIPLPKKARMVLSISMPMRDQDLITIDSVNSSCDSAEIMLPLDVNNIGLYQPVSDGHIIEEILASGCTGVWRLMYGDYTSTKDAIVTMISEEEWFLQPEDENFMLTELIVGGTVYFKKCMNDQDTRMETMKFSVKEKKLIHSLTTFTMDKSTAALLVVSPNHGTVAYQWQYKNLHSDVWTAIKVPSYTCLLYVNTARKYRCMVDDKIVLFDVKAPKTAKKFSEDHMQQQHSADMMVSPNEIELKEQIGKGCFGIVYRGMYKGDEVAVKKIIISAGISKEMVLKNSRELAALKLLKHPNIVSLVGYTVFNDELIIIMNFINGKTLHHMIFDKSLANAVKMTSERCKMIAKAIADGLHFMHTQTPAIIHQDLKPLNIMVTFDLDGVYICDLGLAKLKDAAQQTMTTATQHVVGTYPYTAPEMFTIGHRGAAVDVYSLGCSYIELFGKKRVWPAGMSSPQIMQRICGSFECPPKGPSVDHLLPKQQLLCSSCCQLDYKKRPNIGEVIKLLNDC